MPKKYAESVNVSVPFSDKEQKARWKAKLKAVGESQFRTNGMAIRVLVDEAYENLCEKSADHGI